VNVHYRDVTYLELVGVTVGMEETGFIMTAVRVAPDPALKVMTRSRTEV
jgi:hypothetical protein